MCLGLQTTSEPAASDTSYSIICGGQRSRTACSRTYYIEQFAFALSKAGYTWKLFHDYNRNVRVTCGCFVAHRRGQVVPGMKHAMIEVYCFVGFCF